MLLILAFAVAVGAYTLVAIASGEGVTPGGIATVSGGLILLTIALHTIIRWQAPYADPVILPIATAINGLGLAFLHRIDIAFRQGYAPRQLMWTALGMVAAAGILIGLRNHRGLGRYAYTALAISLVLLVLPLMPLIGFGNYGARIWIKLFGMTFQPGELAKLTLTVFFAGYLVTARDSLSLVGRKVLGLQLPRGRDLGPILLAWMVSVGVLVVETDLGTSLLFFGLFVAMLYVATERISWIIIGLGLFLGGAFLAWTRFGHVQLRVDIWLHAFAPENIHDPSYQLVQGLYGLAGGGLLGTGLGEGRPTLVPLSWNDFIYPALGEELGLTGLVALLMLYLLLVERGLRTAIGVRDGFGKLLATGLSFSIALQVFVVVGGVTRLIPLTGLTMPFLAAGGSSLLGNWMIVAVLLRISDSARRPAPGSEPGAERIKPPIPAVTS